MTQKPFTVAIVDDDPMMCQLIEDLLGRKFPNAQRTVYHTGEAALASGFNPDLVILDYHLDSVKPDALNGLQVLSQLKQRNSSVPVIFLSGQDRLDVATNTMKFGAYDYIVKNDTTFARLENAITKIQEVQALRKSTHSQGLMNNMFWLIIAALVIYVIYMRMQ